MDDITIGVTEFVNNILVSAQPNDQTIDITVTETVETVLLDVSTTVQEVTVTATQNVIVENITVDYVNNENNIDINVTDGTQDVTLNVTPTLVEINILRSGGEVNILQFDTRNDFPATGSSDYFYLAKDTNKLYRWTGSAYAEIAATANARWGQIIGTLSEQTDLQNALNLKAPINSPTFTGTVSGITKVMVGLGAVDNTSDLDKPISTATQSALNNKQPLDADLTSIAALSGTFGLLKKTANNSYTIDTNTYLTGITSSDVTTALGFTPENVANKGINNGYASLGGDGKVPSSQLPSYVDDVIEVSSFGTLPTTGETGKIYITLDTNKIYRWSGSVYVEVSSSAAVWGGITGTLSNQTDLQNALNAKQDDLNGTGFVKASGTTISYDNTVYYPDSNPDGYTSNVGTVTSVAMTVPSAFSVSGSPITSSGTLAITGVGTTAQYVRGDGTLATLPDFTGYVPYTGATANVDLGTHTIIAAKGTFSSSGSGDTVGITHSSGSGIALNITKGGNGEGLYINKTSGSGNAATIVGTLNATTLVKSGGTSSQFLKADGSVDSSTYLTSASLSGYVATTGDQSIAGDKTFSGAVINDGDLYIKQDGTYSPKTGYVSLFAGATNELNYNFGNSNTNQTLTFSTTSRNYIFPNASGTIALTSDIPSLAGYVPTSRTITINGTTFDLSADRSYTVSGGSGTVTSVAALTLGTTGTDLSSSVANGTTTPVITLNVPTASATNRGALSATDWTTFNNKLSSATAASTYLPLTGGTLTGALGGTTISLSGSASTNALVVNQNSGFTALLVNQSGTGSGIAITNAGNTDGLLISHTGGRGIRVNSANAGYGIIVNNDTASTSIPFTIQKSGADRITFTDAGAGTFASTLSATGATLTGALSGTSATFSGKLTVAGGGTNNILVSQNNGSVTIPTTGLNIATGFGVGYIENRNGGNLVDLYYNASNHIFNNNVTATNNVNIITNTNNGGILKVFTSSSVPTQSDSFILSPFGNAIISNNIVYDSASGYRYDKAGFGATIRLSAGISNQGSINFNTFISGTAGAAATEVTRMKIDNDGKVGIGTTSATNRLSIFESTGGTTSTMDFSTTGNTIKGHFGMFNNNFYLTSNWFFNGTQNADSLSYGQAAITFDTSTANGSLSFATSNAGATSPIERMKISPLGAICLGDNLQPGIPTWSVGTTVIGKNGTSKIIIGYLGSSTTGAVIGGHSSALDAWADLNLNATNLIFRTNGETERMRITSGGQVLFGMTSATGAETINVNGTIFGGSQYGILFALNSSVYGGQAARFYNKDTSSVIGSITMGAATTSYNVTSDYRLKEDLKPIKGLEIVNKIKVYDYQWKSDNSRMDGVLAHELAEVLPYAVTGVKDGEQMQSVDYSKIVPVMVQAIKELKAKIETLENK